MIKTDFGQIAIRKNHENHKNLARKGKNKLKEKSL
jgi:hypothetical protein